jgi:hypothetical protein
MCRSHRPRRPARSRAARKLVSPCSVRYTTGVRRVGWPRNGAPSSRAATSESAKVVFPPLIRPSISVIDRSATYGRAIHGTSTGPCCSSSAAVRNGKCFLPKPLSLGWAETDSTSRSGRSGCALYETVERLDTVPLREPGGEIAVAVNVRTPTTRARAPCFSRDSGRCRSDTGPGPRSK